MTATASQTPEPEATVALLRTGAGNLASVEAAFERLGVAVVRTDDPVLAREASHVVLPGVGSYGPARRRLAELGLDDALVERITAGRPTLAVCLGLQLLAEGSEEDPDEPGLGLVAGRVTRFAAPVTAPQLGWNRVVPDSGATLVTEGFASYANSYRLVDDPSDWTVSRSEHGGSFVASVERGAVLACQFHPELSGAWGAGLLRRWLEAAPAPPRPSVVGSAEPGRELSAIDAIVNPITLTVRSPSC